MREVTAPLQEAVTSSTGILDHRFRIKIAKTATERGVAGLRHKGRGQVGKQRLAGLCHEG